MPVTNVVQTCVGCGEDVKDEMFVEAGVEGKIYHIRCFKCASCSREMKEYVERDGRFTCPNGGCVDDVRCLVCDKTVVGEYVKVGEQSFHMTCLACATCSKSLNGERFGVDGSKVSPVDAALPFRFV